MSVASSAADLVAIAKRATEHAFARRADMLGRGDQVLVVHPQDGSASVARAGYFSDENVLLSAPLTPENCASKDALARALLASAVTVETVMPPGASYYRAWLREAHMAATTREAASSSLLDVLLTRAPSGADGPAATAMDPHLEYLEESGDLGAMWLDHLEECANADA